MNRDGLVLRGNPSSESMTVLLDKYLGDGLVQIEGITDLANYRNIEKYFINPKYPYFYTVILRFTEMYEIIKFMSTNINDQVKYFRLGSSIIQAIPHCTYSMIQIRKSGEILTGSGKAASLIHSGMYTIPAELID